MKWSRRKPWWLTEGHPGLSLHPAHPWTPHTLHRQAQTLMCAARLHRTLWVPGSTGRVEGACTAPCCSPAGREVGSKGRGAGHSLRSGVRYGAAAPAQNLNPLPSLGSLAWDGYMHGRAWGMGCLLPFGVVFSPMFSNAFKGCFLCMLIFRHSHEVNLCAGNQRLCRCFCPYCDHLILCGSFELRMLPWWSEQLFI